MEIAKVGGENEEDFSHIVFTLHKREYLIYHDNRNEWIRVGLYDDDGIQKPSARYVAFFAHIINQDEIYEKVRSRKWK